MLKAFKHERVVTTFPAMVTTDKLRWNYQDKCHVCKLTVTMLLFFSPTLSLFFSLYLPFPCPPTPHTHTLKTITWCPRQSHKKTLEVTYIMGTAGSHCSSRTNAYQCIQPHPLCWENQSSPCMLVLPLQSLQVPEAGLEFSLNDREVELGIRMRMSYFLTVFHWSFT